MHVFRVHRTYPGNGGTTIRRAHVGIRLNAHFGVRKEVLDSVVTGVREALRAFDADLYGVAEVLVEGHDEDSFVIKLAMQSGDASQADVNAERAVHAIKKILDGDFRRGALQERQRELTLA
jgi:hypothetical protein